MLVDDRIGQLSTGAISRTCQVPETVAARASGPRCEPWAGRRQLAGVTFSNAMDEPREVPFAGALPGQAERYSPRNAPEACPFRPSGPILHAKPRGVHFQARATSAARVDSPGKPSGQAAVTASTSGRPTVGPSLPAPTHWGVWSRYSWSGISSSRCWISSMDTSRKVSTLADLTNLAGRYMSHTQASPIDTS